MGHQPIRTVAFIGLGRMGRPMAGHLAAAGFLLRVTDRADEAVRDFLAAHPGTACRSARGPITRRSTGSWSRRRTTADSVRQGRRR